MKTRSHMATRTNRTVRLEMLDDKGERGIRQQTRRRRRRVSSPVHAPPENDYIPGFTPVPSPRRSPPRQSPRTPPRQSPRSPKRGKCNKTYVIYKPNRGDCTPVIREVRDKAIHYEGSVLPLRNIRGKYRYTDDRNLQ